MKLQTGVSSKDLATLKEIAELERFKESKEGNAMNEKNEAKEQEMNEKDAKIEEENEEAARKLSFSNILKWENCFLKPDNCCVVKVVKLLKN